MPLRANLYLLRGHGAAMASKSRHLRDHAVVDVPRHLEVFFGVEFLLLQVAPVYYGMGVPRGDGAPVIIIPGFLGSDAYLLIMYAWLKRLGYRPYYSGIRFNAECPDRLLKYRLKDTVDQARRETGKKVHLIGHSLGGILARSLGAQRPNEIASVITLGSPFRGIVLHRHVLLARQVVRTFIRLKHGRSVLPHCYTGRCTCAFASTLRAEFPSEVAQTAIYTPHDGVVDWRCCMTGDPEIDVQVSGTHTGLAFSASAYSVIATRLAQHRRRAN